MHFISEYIADAIYNPEKENIVADALSRCNVTTVSQDNRMNLIDLPQKTIVRGKVVKTCRHYSHSTSEYRQN